VAGVLTGDRSGAPVGEVAGALIGMRRSLAANAPGGSGTVGLFRTVGLALAVATLLCGLVRFDDPDRSVDLLAALFLGWLIGWAAGPVAVRGAGQGLRPEWFALLPVARLRLAAGLLAASFAGAAPVITLVAFAALPVAAARSGVVAVVVAVPAAVGELVLVVALSRVVAAALAATLSSRHGQELGGLLIAVVIALASGGWSLAIVVAQRLAEGPGPALSTALRVLPSGWGPVAAAAAARSDWPLAAACLAGLVLLCGLLLAAWAGLLARTMRRPAGRAPRGAVPRGRAGLPPAWRLLPASPAGAVVGRELAAWRRDSTRTLLLVMALLVSGLNLVVPAVAFGVPALLPWVGLGMALIASAGAANLYGEDGTALWLTRMVPGVERADVRGRQAAWLLVVGPATVALTVALVALGGQGWAWPWLLAMVPAVLGATPGLGVWLSVASPVPEKDPQLRAGPFDTGDDPNTSGALAAHGWLLLLVAAAAAVPGAVLVLLGTVWERPALQAAGVLAGVATGGLLYWWGGRLAARRLAARGAELMDLLRLGPPAPAERAAAAPAEEPGRRRRDAAVGVLWTAGVLCVFPQGLVPVAFNLFGVDPQVRVWFAARYLPSGLQLPVAAGFIVVGLAAMWWALTIGRRARRPEA
jgi:ABC-2 type transport system permease protein